MRRPPMTTCSKCGKPIVVPTRRRTPYEHPLQQFLKRLAPTLCATCRMRAKRPTYRV